MDDSPLVTGALRVLFEETGHRVTVAGSLTTAERAATADAPDVVLLDLSLPDGDGLQLIPRLAAAGVEPRAVFAVTGHDDPETRARCRRAGCRDTLVKPVPMRQLLAAVGGALAE